MRRWIACGPRVLLAALCTGPLSGLATRAVARDQSGPSSVWETRYTEGDGLALFLTAVGTVALVAVVLILLTRWDRKTRSLIRLDWFLPALRRPRPGTPSPHRPLGTVLRSLVPSPLRSNPQTKQRGWIRRSLRRFGISWLASPPRRFVQALCLLLFCFLFFYVCWPYSARPDPDGQSSSGWQFASSDGASGALIFQRDKVDDWIEIDSAVFFKRKLDADAAKGHVQAISEDTVSVQPAQPLSDALFDALFTSRDAWTLHEKEPDRWPSHYADELQRKERISAELFLIIDPLVSLSTAIASRSWIASLVCAAVILVVCLLIPRGFCGYLCPLGTTIDIFDWAVARRTSRFRISGDGWWVHLKYYLLAGTLIAASLGVLVSGFVSAIPVITRAMLFLGEPLQSGMLRGWHLVPSPHLGHFLSIGLFLGVLCLGFLQPRFWCKYVCPTGAVFSLGNLFRMTERKVESSCIHCNKCVEICPFDAIKPDFTTRGTDCTMCQSCGGVCPTHAIKFVERWNTVELKLADDPPTGETALGRRGFLSLAAGSAAAVTGGAFAAGLVNASGSFASANQLPLVRPPGSVPEEAFLQMCIRCGECFKACPNNVLQPEAFEQGLRGLWVPKVEADWAGCESSCNACGQVCPTGAIRPLPLEEKKTTRMGLAIVNESTCLPMAGTEACDLCVQECKAAGYDAIEYIQVGTETDEYGVPIEGSGFLAPLVVSDKCVGCGLCQTRCYGINVKERAVLTASAIVVEAGPGKEDRLLHASHAKASSKSKSSHKPDPPRDEAESQLPGENTPQSTDLPTLDSVDEENPFGL